jgi:Restriction endonuclease
MLRGLGRVRGLQSEAMASTVALGDEYERFCAEQLARKWNLKLARSGGPHDRGIDAWGSWEDGNVEVLVQCKRFRKALGVADAREFEAAVLRSGAGAERGKIGIICTASGFTSGAVRHLLASRAALIAVTVAFGRADFSSVLANIPAQGLIPRHAHASVLGGPV